MISIMKQVFIIAILLSLVACLGARKSVIENTLGRSVLVNNDFGMLKVGDENAVYVVGNRHDNPVGRKVTGQYGYLHNIIVYQAVYDLESGFLFLRGKFRYPDGKGKVASSIRYGALDPSSGLYIEGTRPLMKRKSSVAVIKDEKKLFTIRNAGRFPLVYGLNHDFSYGAWQVEGALLDGLKRQIETAVKLDKKERLKDDFHKGSHIKEWSEIGQALFIAREDMRDMNFKLKTDETRSVHDEIKAEIKSLK